MHLFSLGHTLDQLLQHPPHQRDVFDKAQIDYILENITFLQEFLDEFSLVRGAEIQGLEDNILSSAYAAEDIIESRVVDQILENSETESERSSALFCQDLQKVVEEICFMKTYVMDIKDTEGINIKQQPKERVATSGSSLRCASNTMLGLDKDLIQMMERLTVDESNLHILSVVGMGGISKTTLARNVFDIPSIVHHYGLHAWVTISRQYNVHKIFLKVSEL